MVLAEFRGARFTPYANESSDAEYIFMPADHASEQITHQALDDAVSAAGFGRDEGRYVLALEREQSRFLLRFASVG